MTDERDWLAERFEADRGRLRAVAYRMLGNLTEADDAVQETWLRVSRADTTVVENLSGWLTTVVGRVCLNVLHTRRLRREVPLDEYGPEPDGSSADPEHEALLADSVAVALVVVLDTLGPAERLAFVLHDLFGVPFDEIAPLVDRSPAAARQLASRARRRVRTAPAIHDASAPRQREVVEAFLAASHDGDFDTLVALLSDGVVLRADGAAVRAGATAEVIGAAAVAEAFASRRATFALALIDGAAGAASASDGRADWVLTFSLRNGRIHGLELVGDPDRVRQLDVVLLSR